MNKFSLRLTSVVICMVLLGADDVPSKHGDTVEGCRIALCSQRDKYHFGEPIKLQITLQNLERDTLAFGSPSTIVYEFDVTLPDGTPAPPTLWKQAKDRLGDSGLSGGQNVQIKLRRGESRTDDYGAFNRQFDMSLAGKYVIIAHRKVPDESGIKPPVEIRSNGITVEMLEPS